MADQVVAPGESIQLAINAANDGDTIIVLAGTYDGFIINKDVTVISLDGAGVTFINGTGTNNQVDAAVKITAAGATLGDTLHGFTINAGASEVSAVYVAGTADDVRIEGNVINGNATAAANHLHQGLLTEGGVANLSVDNNTFGGTADQLAYVNGALNVGVASTNVDFTSNQFTGTAIGNGALLVLDADSSALFANSFSGIGGAAVVLQQPGDLVHASNSFASFGSGTDIVTVDTTFSLVGIPSAENLAAEFAPSGVNFTGNDNNNVITGNVVPFPFNDDFDDTLSGLNGNDTLNGLGGDDNLVGGNDNDTLNGGAGTDTALYGESIEVSDIASSGSGGWTVTTDGAEGIDTLNNVEIIDGAEAGRIRLVGNGGYATLQEAVDAADAGDTIVIAADVTLSGDTIVNKDVTIFGANHGVPGTGARGLESVVDGNIWIQADDQADRRRAGRRHRAALRNPGRRQ
jgi:Ca2+-binding RTX toxin-like protein